MQREVPMGAERTFKAKLDSQGHNGAWTLLPLPFDVEKVFGASAASSKRSPWRHNTNG